MLLRIEVLVFFLSFFYIIYYGFDCIYAYYCEKKQSVKNREERRKIRMEKKKIFEKQQSANDEIIQKKSHYVSAETSEKLREISKRVQINISRGYYDSARALIIEGLAINKHDKELNLLLADIYEREKKYQNAEYIYRDLLDEYGDDEYMLQRLGNIYTLREKIEKSYKCYKKALEFNPSNTKILDILCHITMNLKEFKKCLKYANAYLKEKPRDAEKLAMKGYSLEQLGKKSDAKKAYVSVLEIQPYNSDVQDRLKALN